jgi:hypothetical protein
MLMARFNNDRSHALQSGVHCSLVIRESTVPLSGTFGQQGGSNDGHLKLSGTLQ